jgi:hypothetical protein
MLRKFYLIKNNKLWAIRLFYTVRTYLPAIFLEGVLTDSVKM